jgi:hypothetical protein
VSDAPLVSVLLPARSFDQIAQAVDAWRAQTIRERVELVVVIADGATIDPTHPKFEGFAGVRIVATQSLAPSNEALACGIRAASSALVYLGETHAFPEPDVAEVLAARHRQGWTAVVPAVVNANPGVLSSAGFLCDYGRWAGPEPRELERVPSHNVALDREILLAQDERIAALLELGASLAAELRRAGGRVRFEPEARVRHFNVAQPGGFVAERLLIGRVVAVGRSASWSLSRRVAYAAAAPLVPSVLLLRIWRDPPLRHQLRRLPFAAWLALGAAVVLAAAGEAVGYLAGPGRAHERRLRYELDRLHYV